MKSELEIVCVLPRPQLRRATCISTPRAPARIRREAAGARQSCEAEGPSQRLLHNQGEQQIITTEPMGGQKGACYGERMAPAKSQGSLASSFSCALDGAPRGFLIWLSTRLSSIVKMDALGYEPMAFRMRR